MSDPMVGQAVVRCPGCGEQRWHGYGNCMSCGAPGTAADVPPPTESCPECDGQGFDPDAEGDDDTCPACGGFGR